jgi:hypothetical protein
MAAETAAQRFARDTAYKTLTAVANHEDGDVRFARNYADVPDERSLREYADGAGDSALENAIQALP